MATDIFLKIDGLEGESKDDTHGKEIQILSFKWAAENTGTAGIGQHKTAGKVDVKDMLLRKYIDKASPTLMLCCSNGKRIKDCKLTVRRAGEKPLEYVTITMSDCLISSVSIDEVDDNGLLVETVGLNFGKYEYVYKLQGPDGAAAGDVKATWDIVAGKAA